VILLEYRSREEIVRQNQLQECINFLAGALEAGEEPPEQKIERASSDEFLNMAQDSFVVAILFQFAALVDKKNDYVRDANHKQVLQSAYKEILAIVLESQELKKELKERLEVEESLSPTDAFKQVRNLRRVQIQVLKGLILETIQILEKEKRSNYA